MTFARPDLFPLLLLLPAAFLALVWFWARRRRRTAERIAEPRLLEQLGLSALRRTPTARFLLLPLAAAALAAAAIGPRWGVSAREAAAPSVSVVVAFDISRSMLAADLEPNRLERARLLARRLLREMPADRFGLVVFAGRAYVLSPLTIDHSALVLYLDALDPAMVSQGGSSLAAAIAQAADLARGAEESAGDRVVVLISDGEALEEVDAVHAAADRAARLGVRVHTVGVGTEEGARLPDADPNTGAVLGYKRDETGEIVISRLDPNLLQLVADRAGGAYVQADDPAAVTRLVERLSGLQRSRGGVTRRVEPREWFPLFVGMALLLLMLDILCYGVFGARVRSALARAWHGAGSRFALLLVLTVVAGAWGIGDFERGNRLYREARYEEAVDAYRRALGDEVGSPALHYNLGTALLRLGRYDEAEQHLQLALRDIDPDLRERAHYNLGNRYLEDARATQEVQAQAQLLAGAVDAYRRALRLLPGDLDAKWNLEMALREQEENEQRQSLSSPDADPDQQPEDGDDAQPQQAPAGGAAQSQGGQGADSGARLEDQPMSEQQADRILSAAEQDERELTREKLRRGQRRTPVLRDW